MKGLLKKGKKHKEKQGGNANLVVVSNRLHMEENVDDKSEVLRICDDIQIDRSVVDQWGGKNGIDLEKKKKNSWKMLLHVDRNVSLYS